MYLLVSFTNDNGPVVQPGLTLVEAYRLLNAIGRGAIFRATGLTQYSRPVYPRMKRV